jgi:hypothetical protein
VSAGDCERRTRPVRGGVVNSLEGWLELARGFVETLPAKSAAAPKKGNGK